MIGRSAFSTAGLLQHERGIGVSLKEHSGGKILCVACVTQFQ